MMKAKIRITAFVDGVRRERERIMSFDPLKLRANGTLRFLPEETLALRQEFSAAFCVPAQKVKIIQMTRVGNVL